MNVYAARCLSITLGDKMQQPKRTYGRLFCVCVLHTQVENLLSVVGWPAELNNNYCDASCAMCASTVPVITKIEAGCCARSWKLNFTLFGD